MQWRLLLCCLLLGGGWPLADVLAQTATPVQEAPLIDQQPFDLITLTPDAGGASVKVFPLPFAGRRVPAEPQPADKLSVVLQRFPEREYEVTWRDIAKIELYEQLIYDEALAKLADKDFITAFQNLSFLLKHYPAMPRLEELRQEFLLKSAADRYQAGEYRQTLSALEELRATAPRYQEAVVTRVLSQVADALISGYQDSGDFSSAMALLHRLEQTYGSRLPVVETWHQKLKKMALAKREEALLALEQKQSRQARQAAVDMLQIAPELSEGRELIERINRLHAMVRVGVMQRSGDLDPTSLVD
ncbi:MAG: hypothetical protein KDA45_02955, partial [Planctomycetales bacterium]|nr:hypothetical protein [Planctomycetales bacterium]